MIRAAVLALATLSCGCTVLGAAAGAGMPHYEPTAWPHERVARGSEVRVRVRAVGADSARVREIDGRYGGVRDGALVLMDDAGEIPLRDVAGVETREGSEWKKGLLLGAVVDVCAAAAVVAVATSNGVGLTPAGLR